MRRIAVLLLSLGLLAVPAVAAAYVRSIDDGTLNVKDGVGTVYVGGKGALVGHLDRGSLKIFDPAGDAADVVVSVWGDPDVTTKSDTTTVYSGTNLRFRVIGRFRSTVKGSDIDLSAVGQGKVGLKGTDGTYAFNGHTRQALPDEDDLTMFDLKADDSATPGTGG